MTDMFLEKFRALVPKYLEDEWQEADGLSEQELDEALAEHQFTIPLVLREFYLALGGCEDLMEAYHYFWDPDELDKALADHQFQIPLVLREFYLALGGC